MSVPSLQNAQAEKSVWFLPLSKWQTACSMAVALYPGVDFLMTREH